MMRRMISMLLCLAMVLSLLPQQAAAVTEVRGDFIQSVRQITYEDHIPAGYTAISTESELRAITQNPAGLYILMEDIELTRMEILCSYSTPFTGVLEGNGHTISGIDISVTGKETSNYYWGLFAAIENARIANLKVSGSLSMTVNEWGNSNNCYIGGIAGLAKGNVNIVNCVNDVAIYYGPNDIFKNLGVGGIVGYYEGRDGAQARFTACRNMAEICGYADTAGIVGYLYTVDSEAELYACMNTGRIDSRTNAGGMIGEHKNYSGSGLSISSCANSGEIRAEGCGGMIGYGSDRTYISDCLNTGMIRTYASQSDFGGMAGITRCPIIRCINTGDVIGSVYNAAIACTVRPPDDQTAEDMLSTCYWLGGGETNTLYRSDLQWAGILETGMLTAEEMRQEESFVGYEFPEVWTMDEKQGHPVPTALLDLTLENTYESAYIENTLAFVDDSYRYTQILGGSGDGSFAGVVADTYRQAGLDKVNGFWNALQFAEGLANYTVESVTGYDVLLADLIGGSVSRNIRDEHITTASLSMFSEIITEAGAGLDAAAVLQTEKYLADMAELPTIFGDPAKKLMDGVRKTVLKDIPFDDFSGILNAVGGVVNVAGATAAGCDTVDEAFDFYVLCNAFSDVVSTYGAVIWDSAIRAADYDAEKGSELIQSANVFVDTLERTIADDPQALYDAAGGAMANIAGVTGFTVLEAVLKIKDLNLVLSVLDGVKTGIAIGMPVADALTNMDKIAYYGTLLELCGNLSKGMFAEVQARRDAFAHSQTFEDARAVNVAATLYLNLQILACDYAIGYCNAIIAGGIDGSWFDRDEMQAAVDVQAYKDKLLDLQVNGRYIAVGTDGSINGFIAKCPVTVTVSDQSDNVISRLKTGDIFTEECYGGSFMLLGDSGEHKAGLYNPNKHFLSFTGEGSGTMDLVIYSSEDGTVTKVDIYEDVPLEEGTTYVLTPSGLQGDTLIPPTSSEESELAPASIPMYRMYDPNSGEHFYSGAELERDFLVEAGWHYEGVGFNFPEEGAPVHRLYDPVHGEHLYTMDEAEMNKLLAEGWNYEGVAFNSAGTDEVPQYRLHNPNAKRGGYHFTGSDMERDILIEAGWEYQGIGWYSCLE